MNKKNKVFATIMGGIFGLAVWIGLLGIPLAKVSADEQPTPIPTTMSNTLVAVEVSKPTVNAGEEFDLNVTINTDQMTWGAQFEIQFDPKLVELTSNSDNSPFYKDYADKNNGTFLLLPPPVIDNKAGNVGLVGVSVVGVPAGSGGPTGKGVLLTFHGKAKAGSQGAAKFQLTRVIVSDAGNAPGGTAALGGVKTQDGVLAIGGSAPVATEAPKAAIDPASQSGPTTTFEPTVAKRTSLDPTTTDASSSSIPWVIIIPVIGVLVIGAGAVVVMRKK